MHLEVISQGPEGPARSVPLVFVHGAYAGAWVWEPHFLPYFASRGHVCHAVSLRGHGGSDGRDGLMTTRLADYVHDVESVVDSLAEAPVLIGHSMGGMVVQKMLHRRRYPGAILMASAPPHGLLGSWINMMMLHPDVAMGIWSMQTLGPSLSSLTGLKRALFSNETSDDVFLSTIPRFEAESAMVILDMLGLDLPPSRRSLDLPVLVLGTAHDVFVYPGAVRETAKTYGTREEIFPRIGHAMMLDRHWRDVADRMEGWLTHTYGGADEAPAREVAA